MVFLLRSRPTMRRVYCMQLTWNGPHHASILNSTSSERPEITAQTFESSRLPFKSNRFNLEHFPMVEGRVVS